MWKEPPLDTSVPSFFKELCKELFVSAMSVSMPLSILLWCKISPCMPCVTCEHHSGFGADGGGGDATRVVGLLNSCRVRARVGRRGGAAGSLRGRAPLAGVLNRAKSYVRLHTNTRTHLHAHTQMNGN